MSNNKKCASGKTGQYQAFYRTMRWCIPLFLGIFLALWGVWVTQGSPKIAVNENEIEHLKEQVKKLGDDVPSIVGG